MPAPANNVVAAQAIQGWAATIDTAWTQHQNQVAPPPVPGRNPVIIVAGTFSPGWYYEEMAAKLRADGYQVSIFQLPGLGTTDIDASAQELAKFADQVRAQTGADKVDLVGHSQGGLVARDYVKYGGGADHVGNLIGLASPNHGTALGSVFGGLSDAVGFPAISEMAPGSDFLNRLNDGDDTIGNVRYTNIYSSHDEIVLPPESATLDDGATNVRVQDQLPFDPVEHLAMPLDPGVENGVEDALRGEPVDLAH